jgi:hypothetical protein
VLVLALVLVLVLALVAGWAGSSCLLLVERCAVCHPPNARQTCH